MMNKIKILIIDDYLPLLEDVSQYLNFEGFKSFCAKNGPEGIQMAIQYFPDIILCDIEMPHMNGYQVYDALSKIPTTSSIPFIFLTAKATIDDFKKGLKLGADDYITKPFKMNDLLKSISIRLKKIEQIKEVHKVKFESLIKTPLVGIFIYIDNRFTFTNKKFEDITTYSKKDLNSLPISNIITKNQEFIASELSNCLHHIQESVQLDFSILNKEGKPVYIYLFAIHVTIDSKDALLGSIIQEQKAMTNSLSDTESVQHNFNKIITYFKESGKNEIAEQIIEAREFVTFQEDIDIKKAKEEDRLTNREIAILKLICEGYTNKEIAEKVFLSIKTINNHRTNILFKTGVKNTAMLVKYAVKNKYIEI
jgi:PAS domain S-box-containing protein